MSGLNPLGTNSPAPIDNTGASWLAGGWWQQLQPGSWRGVPFVMDGAPTKVGRRVAVHEYPYRDTVWAEDLGKLPRRFQLQAFLVGDDCYQQKMRMMNACEQLGIGTLVHPTLGSQECVLIDFTTTDRRDRGRFVEVDFEFIAAGSSAFPVASAATGDMVANAAGALNSASASSLGSVLPTLKPVPTMPTGFVNDFANLAVNVVNDPARSLNAVSGLVGLYGRYATGRMSNLLPITATVSSALADSAASRQAVITAANALVNVAQRV